MIYISACYELLFDKDVDVGIIYVQVQIQCSSPTAGLEAVKSIHTVCMKYASFRHESSCNKQALIDYTYDVVLCLSLLFLQPFNKLCPEIIAKAQARDRHKISQNSATSVGDARAGTYIPSLVTMRYVPLGSNSPTIFPDLSTSMLPRISSGHAILP